MTTARPSLEDRTSAGAPDQAARHHPRTSKLFKKDHAYAARLVQIATAIRSAARSAMITRPPGQDSSEIGGDDGITAGVVGQSRAHGSGP